MNPIAAALRANPALSDAAIAAICDVTRARVQAMRKRLGIDAAPRGRPLVAVRCPVCAAPGAGSGWLTQHRSDSPACNRRRLDRQLPHSAKVLSLALAGTLTQQQIAAACGIVQSTVSRIINRSHSQSE